MSGIVLNAHEVFEVAKRIETNAATFYRGAAKASRGARDLFLQMAEQEDRHRAAFTEMQSWLAPGQAEPASVDTFEQRGIYLQAVADRQVFDGGEQTGDLPNATRNLTGIIDHALAIEKQAVLFYVGMKAIVLEQRGLAAVDQIIEEEMGHVAWLYDYRSKMMPSKG